MHRRLNIGLFLLFILSYAPSVFSQNCSQAGKDTSICGYSVRLEGQPGAGQWSYVCREDKAIASIFNSGSNGIISVTRCGDYKFVYKADDCSDSDTIQVTFYDPSDEKVNIQYDISLGYDKVECHDFNPDTCGNRRIIAGKNPPLPQWNFNLQGICSGTRYLIDVNGVDSSTCLANAINIRPESFNLKGERHWSPTQNVLIRIGPDGHVEQNIFVSFLQILTNSLENQLKDSCGILSECTQYTDQCIDTLYDTTYLSIPVRSGGHWTFIGQGGAVGLDTLDRITINNKPYSLLVKPSPKYYGPDPITFELWEIKNNKRVNIDTALQADVFWEEDWFYDTIRRVVPKYIQDTTCLNCGFVDRVYGAFHIPMPPVISSCNTLLLNFTPLPLLRLPSDTAICDGEILILDPGEFKDYKWENGITSRYRSVLDPGTYSVTVTAPNGCIDSATTLVTNASAPVIHIQRTDSSAVCLGDPVGLDLVAPNRSRISWSTGDSTRHISVQAKNQNIIGVEVIDSNGCLARDTFVFVGQSATIQINAGPDQTLNCGQHEVQPMPDSSTRSFFQTYFWSGPGIDSMKSRDTFPVLDSAGLFYLAVLDTSTGCYARDTFLVNWDTLTPYFSKLQNRVLDCTRDSILIDLENTLDDQWTLSWTGPGIDSSNAAKRRLGLRDTGWYFIEVCNPQNLCCTYDSFRLIRHLFKPLARAGSDQRILCREPYVWIGDTSSRLSPNTLIQWMGPGIVGPTDSIPTKADRSGSYILLLTDTLSHCEDQDTVMVFASETLPVASAGEDIKLSCDEPIALLDASNSVIPTSATLTWNGPDVNASNRSDIKIQVQTAGQYILTIEDTISGCVSMDTVLVTGSVNYPRIDAGVDKILTCITPNTQLAGIILNPNLTQLIRWEGPGINDNNRDQLQPKVEAPGVYYLTVTDSSSGCSTLDSVEVLGLFNPAKVNAGEDKQIDCNNREVRLVGSVKGLSPKASFIWTGPGVSTTNQNNLVITVDTPGFYILQTQYPNSFCNRMDTVQVELDTTPPVIVFPDSVNINCITNRAVIEAIPSDTARIRQLIWSAQHGYEYLDKPYKISLTSPDTVRVFARGTNGCSLLKQIIVKDWNRFDILFDVTPSCPGDSTGTLAIHVSPAQSGPFTYSTDSVNFGSGNTIKALPAGQYTAYVRNDEGCILSKDFIIDTFPSVNLSYKTMTSCDSPPTGQIILTTSPNHPGGIFYLINGPDSIMNSTGVFDSIPGGVTYKAYFIDTNQCILQAEISIDEADHFILSPTDTIYYCREAFVTLEAEEEDTPFDVKYDWGTKNDTTSTRVVPAETNEYTVIASNACTTQSKTFIVLSESINIDTIGQIPLAFTPNGDNHNEEFGLILSNSALSSIAKYRLQIFDRWGKLIFQSEDPLVKWDGSFHQTPQASGSYLYILEVAIKGCDSPTQLQSKVIKGDVLLIR